VRKIVDEHHGRVELANLESGGARVTVVFPRAASNGVG
jgi:nitrogen fixation/metabolism regulation signal transduction histidine kinase